MFAKPQLFMLHFAGGSCFSFDFLLPYLQDLEVHRLELPGRGKRMGQAFVQSHRAAIDDYLNQIIPKLEPLQLPKHPLETMGFDSIGCRHCTVPGAGRSGRWKGQKKTECGLHTNYFMTKIRNN